MKLACLLDFQSIVGEEQCKHIVSEYLRRRGDSGPSDLFTFQDREVEAQREAGLHAYVKPKEDEIWSAGSKKISKTVKQKIGIPEDQGNAPPSTQGLSSYYNLIVYTLLLFVLTADTTRSLQNEMTQCYWHHCI